MIGMVSRRQDPCAGRNSSAHALKNNARYDGAQRHARDDCELLANQKASIVVDANVAG
jgi:hypothetical protein